MGINGCLWMFMAYGGYDYHNISTVTAAFEQTL
jgi:hypothetical protein